MPAKAPPHPLARHGAGAVPPPHPAQSSIEIADVGYFLFNTFVYAGIFGMAAVSYQFLTNGY